MYYAFSNQTGMLQYTASHENLLPENLDGFYVTQSDNVFTRKTHYLSVSGDILTCPAPPGPEPYYVFNRVTMLREDPRPAQSIQKTAERVARQKRQELLEDTDWITIRSYETNQPVPQDWLLYRQQLRDITNQAGWPVDIIWPTKPE
jgi:hypothetical protein